MTNKVLSCVILGDALKLIDDRAVLRFCVCFSIQLYDYEDVRCILDKQALSWVSEYRGFFACVSRIES